MNRMRASGVDTSNGDFGVLANHQWFKCRAFCGLTILLFVSLPFFTPPARGDGVTIISPPTVTNAMATLNGIPIVKEGEVLHFTVSATGTSGNPLTCTWDFGDGGTSSDCEPTHVYTNCGPEAVNVTISDGISSTNASFDVAVPCHLTIWKLQTKLNFAKTNADSCTVKGTFRPLDTYSFAGKLVTLDIGDAQVSFIPNSKGIGHNSLSTLKMKATGQWVGGKHDTWTWKNGLWTFNATLKKGSWQTAWTEYGMIGSNIPKPGVLVTNLPVILVLDTEAFMGSAKLHYTAKQGKSGTAK